jgi:hypothetical protein
MVRLETVHELALAFPETDTHPHFNRIAFRVRKKIFATLSEKENTLNLMLSVVDQSVFCAFDREIIYPVPGGWGKKGATTVNLARIKLPMLRDALTVAYCNIAPPKLAEPFRRE